MTLPRQLQHLLLAAAAGLVLWQAAYHAAETGRLGIRATLHASSLELSIVLPMLCVQVTAVLFDDLRAVTRLTYCGSCHGAQRDQAVA